MSSSTTNILIVEPSVLIFRGLASVLSDIDNHCNTDHLSGSENIERHLSRKNTDLVIINPLFVVAEKNRFRELRRIHPDVKFLGLIYSVYETEVISLFDGIITVTDHPGAISATLRQALKMTKKDQKNAEFEALSARETEVLKLLVEGAANKEIADRLNISVNTVVTHRKNISKKTGIKSVSGLTVFAIVEGIVSIDMGQHLSF